MQEFLKKKKEKRENYDLAKYVTWLESSRAPSGYLKRKVKQNNPCSKEQLKQIASEECQNITPDILFNTGIMCIYTEEDRVSHPK